MKKRFIVLLALMVLSLSVFVSCRNGDGEKNKDGESIADINTDIVYTHAQQHGYAGSLSELDEALKNGDAYAFVVSNNYNGSETEWLVSLIEAKSSSELVPFIGTNGNWFIGKTDTGVRAKGSDGMSAYEIYLKYYPEYEGDEEQWINDLANGKLARFSVSFDATGGNTVASINNIQPNSKITAPTEPTRPDHDFDGWYIDSDYSKIWNFATDVVSSDITLFAKWNYIRSEGLSFELNSDETGYTVTGRGSWLGGHLSIPSVHNGLPITKIGDHAFSNSSYHIILSLVIPSSIETIEDFAFSSNHQLSSVTFEENSGLRTIKNGAFSVCGALGSIVIPASVRTLNTYAFGNCDSLSSVTFENDSELCYIYDRVFFATKLTSITLPKSIIHVGDSAFSSTTLTKILIAGSSANLESVDGILYNKDFSTIVAYPGAKVMDTFRIPSTVTTIRGAFKNGIYPKKVVIPSTVTYILDGAFQANSGIEEVVFEAGSTLTALPTSLFSDCINLKSVNIPSNVGTLKSSVFLNCKSLETVTMESDNRLGIIENSVFSGCTSLKSFDIPSSVVSIGNGAFRETALTDVVLPRSLASLGTYNFYNCQNLKSIVFQDGIKTIPEYTFYSNFALESITIPSTVTSIGYYAFYNCQNLYIYMSSVIPPAIGNNNFYGVRAIFVHEVLLDFYKSQWPLESHRIFASSSISFGDYLIENGLLVSYLGSSSIVTIPSSVTAIADNAFLGRDRIVEIIIPNSVKSIGNRAFEGCTSLELVSIPSSVTSIGLCVFINCRSLTTISVEPSNPVYSSVDGVLFDKNQTTLYFYPTAKSGAYSIPSSVTALGEYAFYLAALDSVSIPSSVESIGKYAFYGCGKLLSVSLPQNLTRIEASAFEKCILLSSVDIPSGVTFIDNRAFASCAFETIGIPSTTTELGSGVFSLCKKLKSVTIPNSVAIIGTNLFYGCEALKSVVFEDESQLDYLRSGAFIGCSSLESVDFGQNSLLDRMGSYIFRDCLALKTVVLPSGFTSFMNSSFSRSGIESIFIPKSVTTIGTSTFSECANLTSVIFEEGIAFPAISSSVFRECTSLVSISIPASVKQIAPNAFSGCYSLREITFEGSEVVSLSDSAFNYCFILESIYLLDEPTLSAYKQSDLWKPFESILKIKTA